MQVTKRKLRQTIYTYFPKGIEYSDEAYDNAPETQLKLISIKKRKVDNSILFTKLINTLKTKINTEISDQSPCYDKEFCNYIRFNTKIENYFFRFHILLSFLEPYHCIMVTCYDQNQHLIFTTDCEDIGSKIELLQKQKKILLSQAEMITKEINDIFKTSGVKMGDLQEIVPDIETGDNVFGNVKLFDCLFTATLQYF